MAYTLTYSLGTITVIDTTLNNQTSLNLPGRNYAGYGQPVDQGLLSLLENFAASTPPANPIPGQTWFDTTSRYLRLNVSSNATPNWATVISSGGGGNIDITVGNLIVEGQLTTDNITTGGPTIPGTVTGNWTLTAGSRWNASYADLAERFESDSYYEPGTVMEMGGAKEITEVESDLSEQVFGVISDTAGYLMNATAGDDVTHPAIAMTGRVQVKVVGQVMKGDRLVSAGKGYARAAKSGEANNFNTIGRALENKFTDEKGKVLAAVSAKI
jgi:hypothetical protein